MVRDADKVVLGYAHRKKSTVFFGLSSVTLPTMDNGFSAW
jgi:hypothetical protein